MPMTPNQSTTSKTARILTLGLSDTRPGRLFLRRAASSLMRAALRIRSRPLALGDIPSALVVSPHPDDEAFGCGGTLALMARTRASLSVVFLTDGSASHPGHPTVPASEIARMRGGEARAATAALGVKWGQMAFLDVRDGTLSRLEVEEGRELEDRIAALLTQTRPAAVFLPGRGDGSSEHEAAFASVARAMRKAGLHARILEFPIWSWWNPALLLGPMLSCRRIWRVEIGAVLDVKARALASYASQTLPIAPQLDSALPPGFSQMFLGGGEYFFEW
jgi:LmbE family N-acetylglucosaminyl deacetylase